MDPDTEPEEKESAYLQQMYKSLLSPDNTVTLGTIRQSQPTMSAFKQSQSTLSVLSQSQTTLAALNRMQSKPEREVKQEPTLSPSSIEETVRIIKTNGTKPAKMLSRPKVLKTKQVSTECCPFITYLFIMQCVIKGLLQIWIYDVGMMWLPNFFQRLAVYY